MKKLYLAAVAPALMLSACGSVDPAESVDAIRQNEIAQLQSIEAGDVVGAVRLYRDDAKLVRPDGTILDGGAAIGEAYAELMEDPNFGIVMTPVDGWASGSGDMAVVTSDVAFTTTDPETGEAVTLPLISETVWMRETGATWKIVSAYNVARASAPAEEGAAEAAE